MAASVLDLVTEAREHGDLFHTRGKSVTVNDRRRITIRVQCDIFNVLYGEQAKPYYPDLIEPIRDAWARLR